MDGLVERAFELAPLSSTLSELRRKLIAKGYGYDDVHVHVHLSGRHIKTQLNERLLSTGVKRFWSLKAEPLLLLSLAVHKAWPVRLARQPAFGRRLHRTAREFAERANAVFPKHRPFRDQSAPMSRLFHVGFEVSSFDPQRSYGPISHNPWRCIQRCRVNEFPSSFDRPRMSCVVNEKPCLVRLPRYSRAGLFSVSTQARWRG